MTPAWAVRFPRTSLSAALPLRLRPNVEAHDAGDAVWLRGSGSVDHTLTAALRLVPAAERFSVTGDVLTRDGHRLPTGPLPAGPWVAFADLARLRLPPAALPAAVAGRVAIRLVPADREHEPAAVLVPFDRFADWAVTAPLARLNRLRFAVRSDRSALVVGRPLSPVPGTADLVDHDGLLVPAGLAWDPPVDAATVRRALDLPAGELALFDPTGSYERVPAEVLVPVTRAGVRRTRRSGHDTRLPLPPI